MATNTEEAPQAAAVAATEVAAAVVALESVGVSLAWAHVLSRVGLQAGKCI